MKLAKLFLMAGVAGAAALFSSQAMAANTGEITISVAIKAQNTNSVSKSTDTSKVTSLSWSETQVYSLITNALANVGTNGTGIASTNLPAGGYIAFNPNGNDGNVSGVFYVTNKSGLYYPLSGVDTNGNYYSYMELDAYVADSDDTNSALAILDLGFSDNFNGIETGSFNGANGSGSETATSTAVLYVHDNPYSFNEGNNAGAYYGNGNAFEISGVADIKLTFKDGNVTAWDISLQGTGNAVVDNSQNAIVTSGHLTTSSQ